MGFNDKFYKMKASALGVNTVKDTVIYGDNINELKLNVKNILKQDESVSYDYSKYPIKNSMFQLQNKSGETLLSSDYWTTVNKSNIPSTPSRAGIITKK